MVGIAEQARGASDPGAIQQVRAMQVRLLHETWVPFIGNLINGALVVAVLWSVAPTGPLVLWGGLVLAATLIRLLPRHRYLRARPPAEQAPRWAAIYTLGAAVSGSIWGLLALTIHGVEPPIYHAFVGVAVAGMGAGAVATHSAYLPAVFAFLLPTAVPLALALMTKDLMAYHAMGLMTLLFIGLLSMVARSMNRTLLENFVLQFANEELIAQLSGIRNSLETRVRERTGELQRTNLDLQKEVAERERADAALRESELRYRVLFENAPIAIREEDFSRVKARIDSLGIDGSEQFAAHLDSHPDFVVACSKLIRMVDANQACLTLHMAADKTVFLANFTSGLSDRAFAVLKRLFQAVHGGEAQLELETEVVRPDGSRRDVISRWSVAAGHETSYSRILFSSLDITERKLAEDSLKEREAQLEQAQRMARIGVFIWDPIGDRCLYCSEELAGMFGITVREFMANWGSQKDFLLKIHPEDRARYHRAVAKADEQVARYDVEFRTFDGAGNPRYWREIGEPVLDETGRQVRTFGTIQDITAIKTAEAALRESEERLRQSQKLEAVGQLTGGVAHDFNNLLAVIMGNAEVLAIQHGTADQQAQAIIAAAARGAELTDRLLAFSRKQTLRPRAIDLEGLVGGMADLLRRTLGETIEVRTASTPGLWRAMADPGQLENAVLNLALNARDAMPDGGVLTIETAKVSLDQAYALAHSGAVPGDYVVLTAADTGTGMTPEVLERAFEPFFTTKEVGQGSGLGLSMVYGFAKQSDGHVTIASERTRGTTVKLYLPRTRLEAERVGPETPAEDREEPVASGETVLVVEDDAEVRRLAVALLEDLGYQVLHAPDGKAALGIMERSARIDLLLSDVVLPGHMSGPDLAQEVESLDPAIKVLFMSGYPEIAVGKNELAVRGTNLLGKPFRKQELARKVRASLDR